MSEGPICDNCKNPFDENEHIPMTLPCSHPLCSSCIKKIKPNEKIFCQQCGLDLSTVNLKELKPHQMILSLIHSQSNQSESIYNSQEEGENEYTNEEGTEETTINNTIKNNQIEYCNKHKEKEIEFFCQTCTTAVCSKCIFETHNGHHLTLLEDMSTIIKNNVKDFGKILKNLEKVNEDNQSSSENKIDEVEKQKLNQITIVTKSFEEIIKKIEEKKNSIIEEFNNKYFHEIKRFKKIQTCLQNDQGQIERIAHINDELTKNLENFSDAKILKKIEEFTSFLHKSAMDIKRLYKTEISLKAELTIDPSMKPTPINTSDLLHLLEKIDPKNICYYFDESESLDETDDSNSKKNLKYNGGNVNEKNINRNNVDFNNEFDNEINNYIKRIQPSNFSVDSSSKSENYSSDGNLSEAKYKIPKRKGKKLKIKSRVNSNKKRNSSAYYYRNSSANHRASNDYNLERRYQYSQNSDYPIINNKNYDYLNSNSQNNMDKNQYKIRNKIPSAGSRRNSFSNNNKSNPEYILPKINQFPQQDMNDISIYCFGEANYCLKYQLKESKWEIIYYTNDISRLLGTFRYSSICTIPGQKMILTGGCKSFNNEPSNMVFEINSNNINEVNTLKNMQMRRYGHFTIYFNNYFYSIGGYEHIDRKDEMYSTLKNCERFDIRKNKWETISNLNHPRAFFGCVIYKGSIFVFGGVYNDQLLSSIEKYDIYSDIWTTYPIKLPEKLSKMGVINYNNQVIFILGGVNEFYQNSSCVFQGKLSSKKDGRNIWYKGNDMICPRATYNSAFCWEKNIFVFGGSVEGVCEKFDFNIKKWSIFDSYFTAIKSYKVDNVIKNFCCTLNYYVVPE
jgi:hypothetical protein